MTITQSSTRFVAVAAGIALALSLVFAPAFGPAQAAGLTSTQIQSILSLLSSFGADQATINNVNAALNGQATTGTGSTGGTSGAACPALSRSLQQGSTGSDVMALQVFLNSNASTQVAASGAGSPGNETSYFGPATKAAVVKFQAAHGVDAIGIVGPQTRAAIASACSTTGGTTGGNTGGTVGGSVTVSAAAQPVNSLAPKGASRVPFTSFTLTNGSNAAVTINSVTVQRAGLAQDAAFSGVVLLDSNGIQIGNAKTFNSNHQANIGDTGFVLNAGASMTFTVAGNMAADESAYSGQVASLQVVAVNTSATVGGSLPIMGASQTINNTLSVGSFSTSTSSVVPPTSQNHDQNLGDTGVRFAGLRFTASSAEDLKLYSIRWRQIGSGSNVDISNVVTVANGTTYPTTVDSTGKYYTTVFPGGILIPKGNNIDVYLQGDITGSNSNGRTIQFTIDRATDVYFVGQLYGYGISDKIAPNAQPWFTGDQFTVKAGTASTISKSTASKDAAQNIAVNVTNQPLGGFTTNFLGEPVTVSGMTIAVASTSATGGPLTNVSITDDNGAVVAGPVDENSSNNLVFTDSITFPTGMHTYHVMGKIATGAANGSTVTLTVNPTNWTNPTGQVSGSSVSITNASFPLNAMTIQGATTTITVSANPTSQNVVAGAVNFTLANIQIDATQSGEDIRLSSLPLSFSGNNGDLNSCQLFDGTTALTTGSRIINSVVSGQNSFSFDNSLVVPKGTVKTISVVCNISGSAASGHTYAWGIDSSYAYSASGVTSGISVTPTVTTATGGTMTIAAASLAVSVDASSPSYALAAGGQTGVTVGVYKLRASNENLSLTKLGLTLTSGSRADLNQVYIYNGSTLVGTATFTGSTATSTLSTPVTLTKDTDMTLTVKADLADIGTSQPGTEGDLVKIDPLNAEALGSSATVKVGATAGVAGVRVFNTFPTIAADSLPSTGVADGRLMHFKVTADSHGPVGLSQFAFKVATTTATATNVQLFAFTDASYSQAISGQGSGGQVGSTQSTIPNNSVFNITASTPVEVPAGSTYYFELRGSVAGVTTGSSVVTTLLGDSTGTGVSATSSLSSDNFIWSPNATTTVGVNANDFTNGAGITGLPSSGIFQTRSN